MGADFALCHAGVAELARRLRRRELSAVELTRNALARLDAVEPKLNCFVHRDDAGALAAASRADEVLARGDHASPLLGIPVSVKDLIDVAGMPCSYGSRTMLGHVPVADAPSVERLRRAGAVVLGKTTTCEYGFRGYTESLVHGLTRNAWDPARTPGGSSGGAASSVAAGVTPIALATDGGGSIRNPASLCGVVGVKPQYGRVPIWPASQTASLAHVGPIARSVADARALFDVVAGPDPRDWTSLQPLLAPGNARPRIGFSPDLGHAQVDPEIAALVAAAVRRAESALGPVALLENIADDESELFLAEFIAGISARLGAAVDERPQDIDPALLASVRRLREMPVSRFTALLARRHEVRERWRLVFERIDVLLTPMLPVAAWPLGSAMPPGFAGRRMWASFAFPFNLTGQPAASLPCGFTASGLPVGLQVVVKPQDEATLFDVLTRLEDCFGVAGATPREAAIA